MATSQKKSFIGSFLSNRSGSADTKEMTFLDHLEALRWHIVRSLIAWIAAATFIFIYHNWIYDNIILAPSLNDFVSYKAMCDFSHYVGLGESLCMPAINMKLQGTTVSGPFVAALNISMIGGIILAFPYIFYEVWKFVKPALSGKEMKYGARSIFWVSFCFLLGASFGYFVLAPFTFNFLSNFTIGTKGSYVYLPTLDDYISTLTNLLLGCGLAFELPVMAVFLAKLGLITAKFLKAYRKYAYIIILIVAAILTPSPDWISQAIVAMPLVLLFEISIILVKRIDKKRAVEEKRWE